MSYTKKILYMTVARNKVSNKLKYSFDDKGEKAVAVIRNYCISR